jgi:hypothetical protein
MNWSASMTSFREFNALAASRGDGLRPKLRDLLERAAESPFSETQVRHDGMLQAGPSPQSETWEASKIATFSRESRPVKIEPLTAKQRKATPQPRLK